MSIAASDRDMSLMKIVFACLIVIFVMVLVVHTFGFNAYVVMSNSMRHGQYPTGLYSFWESIGYSREQFDGFPVSGGFQAGDLIITEKTDDLKVGDVAVDTRREVPVTHRIFMINGTTVITWGDGSTPQNVSSIPSGEIRQKKTINEEVIAVIPKGGILKALGNCLVSKGCDIADCFTEGECGGTR